MKPRALLVMALSAKAVPAFESLGFRFDARAVRFRRVRDHLVDVVNFTLDPRDDEDTCQFTTHWSVEAPLFSEKHKERWGVAPRSTQIAGSQDWLLRGWPRSSLGFRLLNEPSRIEHEMQELIEGAKLIGVPYLQNIASFEAAAEFSLERGGSLELACALLILSGQVERAHRELEKAMKEAASSATSGKAVYERYLLQIRDQYFPKSEL